MMASARVGDVFVLSEHCGWQLLFPLSSKKYNSWLSSVSKVKIREYSDSESQ